MKAIVKSKFHHIDWEGENNEVERVFYQRILPFIALKWMGLVNGKDGFLFDDLDEINHDLNLIQIRNLKEWK